MTEEKSLLVMLYDGMIKEYFIIDIIMYVNGNESSGGKSYGRC